MAGGATEVHQAAFGEHVNAVAGREGILIDLRLDVSADDVLGFVELVDLDLVVEVADVTNDGLVLHLLHMLEADDIEITGGGDVDVAPAKSVFECQDAESFHGSLQCADRVHFSDDNLRALATKGLGAAFAHIAVAADYADLAGDHHIGGAFDAVHE